MPSMAVGLPGVICICFQKHGAILLLLVLSLAAVIASGDDESPGATCFLKDKEALLSFKAAIAEDTTGTLITWTPATDCCGGGWAGIQCDARSGRVTQLVLQNPEETNDTMYMRGTVSPSLGNLKSLQILIISGLKHITGTIPGSLSDLSWLTQLYIENNRVTGPVPRVLGSLSRLQALSFTGNSLSGPIPPELGELQSLIQLNLGKNRLTGVLPTTLKNIRGLQSLDINGNILSGPIPAFLGSFVNLTYLDLSGNEFTGPIPTSIADLSSIQDLSLSRNRLTGEIPYSLGRMSSLSSLSLSENMLVGVIPESISTMSNLWNLNLSKNHLSDPLPSGLAKASALVRLDLSYNNLHLGRIPDWITKKEMTNLHLAGCGVRQCLSTWKPRAMNSLLSSIDLSNNNLTGDISQLLKNMTSLQRVYLSNNSLTTNLSEVSLPDSISVLDLHSNKLYGSIEKLFYDNISESCPSPGGCLEFINLANNEITGRIPEIDGERSIKWLDLSGNRLKGSVPTSISMLKKIERLDFSRNRMVGKIPGAMGELKELRWLDLSWNGLKGRIPGQILGLKHLKHMNLRNNRLCGEIPQGKPLNVFPASAYAHNDCLCGSPLPRC